MCQQEELNFRGSRTLKYHKIYNSVTLGVVIQCLFCGLNIFLAN